MMPYPVEIPVWLLKLPKTLRRWRKKHGFLAISSFRHVRRAQKGLNTLPAGPGRLKRLLERFSRAWMGRYRELRFWINRWWVHYFLQVDPKAKCPACGVRRKHKIVYSTAYGALVHQCSFCSAAWGERPLVQSTSWAVAMPELSPEEQQQQQERPPWYGASREPRVISEKKTG